MFGDVETAYVEENPETEFIRIGHEKGDYALAEFDLSGSVDELFIMASQPSADFVGKKDQFPLSDCKLIVARVTQDKDNPYKVVGYKNDF